jgi:hypothetical protein
MVPDEEHSAFIIKCQASMKNVPYILESNPHSVVGDFLNDKKLVRGSNPYLSFNRPLPTGRKIE